MIQALRQLVKTGFEQGDGRFEQGDGSYCTPADSGDGSSAASRKEKAGLLFGRLSENDQDLILQMLRRLVIGGSS